METIDCSLTVDRTMTEEDEIAANSNLGDDFQFKDGLGEDKASRGCLCCPQSSLAYRKIQNCFTCMPKQVKSDTGDYGAKSFTAHNTNRKEIFSRLGYHSDTAKVQPDYEMPYLTWSFCQKLQLQTSSDVTMKHKDQVLHAMDVLFFAKILSTTKHSTWYLARWWHQEGWLCVKSAKKNSSPKRAIDMELRCFSLTRNRPFFLQLIQAFETMSAYYMVAPYSGRCSLRYVVLTRGKQTVNNVMFYVMELVHALVYLHENDIFLRNLSPDTVMLDQDGHTLVCDFRLAGVSCTSVAKRNNDTVPIVNLAPEVIKHDNYTKSMDWWSLGSIIYYLLYGQEPFKGSNRFKTVAAILTRHPIFLDKTYGLQLILFCQALLRKSQGRRLGSGTNGSLSVINHSCLRLVDWDQVASRKFAPPFVPPPELHLSNGAGDLKEIDTTTSGISLTDEKLCSGDNASFKEASCLSFCDEVMTSKIRCSGISIADRTSLNLRRQHLVATELIKVEALRRQQKARRASKVHDMSVFEKPSSGSVLDFCSKGRKARNYAKAEKLETATVESPEKRTVNESKCTCGDQIKDVNRSNAGRCCQREKGDGSKSCPRGANLHSRCVLHIIFDKAPNGGPRERVVYGNHVCNSHGAMVDENNSGDFEGADSQAGDVDEVVNQSPGEASVPGTLGDSESTERITESRDESHDSRLPPNNCTSVSHSLSNIAHPDSENVSTGHPAIPKLFHPNESLSQLDSLEHTLEGRHINNNIVTITPKFSESATRFGDSPKIIQNVRNDTKHGVHPVDTKLPIEKSVPQCNPLICDFKMPDVPELKLGANSDPYSNESGRIACDEPPLGTTKESEYVPKNVLQQQYRCDNEPEESNLETEYLGTKSTRSRSEESTNTSFKREINNSVAHLKPTADSGEFKNEHTPKKSSVRFNSLPSLDFGQSQSLKPPPCSFLDYVTSRLDDQCADKAFSRFCQKSSSVSQKVRYPVRAESFQLQSLFPNTVARKPDPIAGQGKADALPLGEEHVGIRAGQFKIATLDGMKTKQDPRSPGKTNFFKRLITQVKNSEVIRRGKPGCEYESAEASMKPPMAKDKNRFRFFQTQRPLKQVDSKANPNFMTQLNVELLNRKIGNNHTPYEPDPSDSARILSECMHMQTSLASNVTIDFPELCKGTQNAHNIEDSKLSLSGDEHSLRRDGSSITPSRTLNESSGQLSLVKRNNNLEIKQAQNISEEKSNRDWRDVRRSEMCDADKCPYDSQMKPRYGYSCNELFITIGVNGTPNQKSTIEGEVQIDTIVTPFDDVEHPSISEEVVEHACEGKKNPEAVSISEEVVEPACESKKNPEAVSISEDVVEPACEGNKNPEAVSHIEDIEDKDNDINSIESIIGSNEVRSESRSCEDQNDSDLKGRHNQFEERDDIAEIEGKSQQGGDDFVVFVKELIDALLADVMSQIRNTDSIDDSSANLTSESTSFVTADTNAANGTSNSTSEFFTADFTSESKLDAASEISVGGSQSFCDSNYPVVVVGLAGKRGDALVSSQESCPQVNEENDQTLDTHLAGKDACGTPLGGEICEQIDGLVTVQDVNVSSDNDANHGNEAKKVAEVENKGPHERSLGDNSSSPSDSESINEASSSKEKLTPDNKYMMEFKELGDECLPDKETYLFSKDVKTECVSSANEIYHTEGGAFNVSSDQWLLPPSYQQRNVPPLQISSVLVAEHTSGTPCLAELSVSHGEEGPCTPSIRARQLMHALDEITPYSEYDAWRYRPVRLRPDNGFLSPREAHEDAEDRDRGSVDDDLQVIGSLTIESLEPPVKGLIYRRKAK